MAGEAVLSAFVQLLYDKLVDAALNEVWSLRGPSRREIQNLSGTLSTIQAFLEDAEEKQFTDKLVRSWLMKIKDVAYDMDELLDHYEAKSLLSNLEGQARRRQWKMRVSGYFHKVRFGYQLTNRLKGISDRLEKIARDRNMLGLQVIDGTSSRLEITNRPQTSSLIDDSSVLGRDEDKENIIQMLLTDHLRRSNVTILPIVGMGGIGKTTLAQLVYNDSRVKDYFELRMWVCVSENFDEMKLTRETLESVTSGYSTSATTNMNLLQEDLCKKLMGKKFLLVLDDVWNEDDEKWSRFQKALVVGKRGSRIVVTTQNENVGRIMAGLPPYRLGRLSDQEAWILFRNCAFVDGNSSGHPELEEIGQEIVERLKGLPIAAKALGSLLYSKLDVEDWKSILKSEIWELPPGKNNILPALRLSYKHLPPHLKQCFAFCSTFHKDYVFEKNNLVQIWIALGFIHPQGRKRLEDIGSSYFDDLLSRSFFQPYKGGNYVMHDAIHDLAQSISIGECLCLGQNQNMTQNTPARARHVSFSCDNLAFTSFEQFYGFKGLRTLLLLRGYKSMTCIVPNDTFQRLRCLRVLDLHRRDICELPRSIGNLIQLRYLALSGTDIRVLPSSISRLCNLQTLKLRNCNSLSAIPKGVTNLVNLRHVEASKELISEIAELGKLTCLQELDEFVVRKGRGYGIGELKDMVELKGHLCIRGLENVINWEEAREAMISTKEHLSTLNLEWTDATEASRQDEEVLEVLRPHPELMELAIRGYAGAKFPSWLGSPSFCYLHTIHLSNCRKCRLLPPLGQLPILRYLDIVGVYGVIAIGQEFLGKGKIGFPSLKELILEDIPDLEDWLYAEDGPVFPCLTDLEIVDCPKLRVVPRIPPNLTRLKISETGLGALPEMRAQVHPASSSLLSLHIHECLNLLSLQQGLLGKQLRSLEELTITDCQELVLLPVECFRHLASLRTLNIYNCPRLAVASAEGGLLLPDSLEQLQVSSCSNLINAFLPELRSLPCLAYLKISQCPDVHRFPEVLPTTLKSLGIVDCTDLQFLPAQMQELSSLETLTIRNCPQISFLHTTGLPRMLRELYVSECPLLKHGFQKYRGVYWPWIAYVTVVEIDGEKIK